MNETTVTPPNELEIRVERLCDAPRGVAPPARLVQTSRGSTRCDGGRRRRGEPEPVDLVLGVARDDPRREDVRALLERHVEFAREHTPPESRRALDRDGLPSPVIGFYSLRDDGELLGVGALKRAGAEYAEIKSMRTAAAATGTTDAFAAARALNASFGFVPCGPSGDYCESPSNTFTTRAAGWTT